MEGGELPQKQATWLSKGSNPHQHGGNAVDGTEAEQRQGDCRGQRHPQTAPLARAHCRLARITGFPHNL